MANAKKSVVPIDHVPTVEEIEKTLRTGHRAIIREADDFRYTADWVHGLILAVLKGHGVDVEEPAAQGEVPSGTPRLWEVWAEGYRATGQNSGATHMGSAVASSFREACRKLLAGNPYFNEPQLTYWGCKLFDNAADARKNFG